MLLQFGRANTAAATPRQQAAEITDAPSGVPDDWNDAEDRREQ